MEQPKTIKEIPWEDIIMPLMPEKIKKSLMNLPCSLREKTDEIRIRVLKPLMISCGNIDYYIDKNGNAGLLPYFAYYPDQNDCKYLLENISEHSVYAIEDEIRQGYITIKGGYRIGIVGKGVIESGKIKLLKYISGFNIRISRQIFGASDKIMPFIYKTDGSVFHSLVISPPLLGKTTMLRDIARQLSNGCKSFKGLKVGIVDERSEIAGCYQGIPQNEVGFRTDVLDSCPKAEGIFMMLRSMSPQVIITDEIGRNEDIIAIDEALNAGVKIITSVHGNDIDDLLRRPVLNEIIKKNIFERYFILGKSLGIGTVEKVIDGYNFKVLNEKPF